MGNCCGSESGNFKGEGRTLSAAPANAPPKTGDGRAAVPPKISSSSGGRTLGGGKAPESSDPKSAAARAAEERARAASQGQGKLGKQLNAQKAQTQFDTLAQNARDNVATRDADAAAQTRNYN